MIFEGKWMTSYKINLVSKTDEFGFKFLWSVLDASILNHTHSHTQHTHTTEEL